MRTQSELRYYIGTKRRFPAFEEAVIAAASRLCGGCFVANGAGYWMTDGASHKETFEGTLETEHTFHLVLTVETAKLERVLETMQEAISDAAHSQEVATDWVHVQETAIRGHHFSVEAFNASKASVAA